MMRDDMIRLMAAIIFTSEAVEGTGEAIDFARTIYDDAIKPPAPEAS